MPREEYIFKCGCRRGDFINPPGSIVKLCPVHKQKMSQIKIRWCDICKKEYECSSHYNRKTSVCPACRPAHVVRMEAIYRERKRKPGTKPRKPRPKKPVIKKKKIENLEPIEPWDSKKLTFNDRVSRMFDERFPVIEMPVMSENLKRICGGAKWTRLSQK